MSFVVTRSNLPEAVDFALESVSERLRDGNCPPLELRDLEVALNALELIKQELESGDLRPKAQRSAAFTRYAVDEAPNLKIDEDLRAIIVRIEELYKRY